MSKPIIEINTEKDERQKLVRDLKESSRLINTAADLLLLLNDSPDEESAKIINDLVKHARELIESANLPEEKQR